MIVLMTVGGVGSGGGQCRLDGAAPTSGFTFQSWSPSAMSMLYAPGGGAGSYTFTIQYSALHGASVSAQYMKLVAYEM
jgi:hypothetical protein